MNRTKEADHSIEKILIEYRPNSIEATVVLITYLVGILAFGVVMAFIPDSQGALRIIIGSVGSGLVGFSTFFAVLILRVHNLVVFGIRKIGWKWLLMGIALGIIAFFACYIIERIVFQFITEPNSQADFQNAAQGGFESFFILIFTTAILAPMAEELIFRGIIANMLNRYGAFAGIVCNALIFGLVHRLDIIFFDAFIIGILTGILFRKTRSIFPGIILHIVCNALRILYFSML